MNEKNTVSKQLNDYANVKHNVQEWLEELIESQHPQTKEDFETIIRRCEWLINDSKKAIDIINDLS